MALLILLPVVTGLTVSGFYAWARGQPATPPNPDRRRWTDITP